MRSKITRHYFITTPPSVCKKTELLVSERVIERGIYSSLFGSVCPSVRLFVSILFFEPTDLSELGLLCVYGMNYDHGLPGTESRSHRSSVVQGVWA